MQVNKKDLITIRHNSYIDGLVFEVISQHDATGLLEVMPKSVPSNAIIINNNAVECICAEQLLYEPNTPVDLIDGRHGYIGFVVYDPLRFRFEYAVLVRKPRYEDYVVYFADDQLVPSCKPLG